MRAVSSEIIERFRSLSLERLARVESAWATLVRGGGGREIATEIARVVHTVKGDARVVGFADVNLVCHKLEDLLAAAAARDYRIPEDLDLMVTMAIQFASLLLRTEHGAAAGIDVAGFVRQVDDAVANTERQRALAPRVSRSPSTRASLLRVRAAPGIERLSAGAQHRLAAAAALVFLEHENATGSARARLLAAFRVLTAELSRLGHVPVSDILKVHVVAAGDLAQRLGKQARIHTGGNDVARGASVSLEIAEALDVAILHCLQNAIDHGIELPAERRAQGKPEAGRITVDVVIGPRELALEVRDDGAGINLSAIRARAIGLGILTPASAAAAGPRDLCELVFRPGFSTRTEVGEASGRGIGLDAVKQQLARVGGVISLSPADGAGTCVRISLPVPARRISVLMFQVPGVDISFAVTGEWTLEDRPAPRGAAPIDLARAVGLNGRVPARGAQARCFRRRGRVPAEVWVAMAGDAIAATAERIAATSDDQAIEIVRIAGTYAIVVRLDRVSRRV